jgi:multiple sugar transport system substrate-binding protein
MTNHKEDILQSLRSRRNLTRSAVALGLGLPAAGAMLTRSTGAQTPVAADGEYPIPAGVDVLDLANLSPDVPDPTENVTITFASWVSDQGIMAHFVEEFQSLHPTIKVNLQGVPAEQFNDKLATQIAGGNPPDSVYMDSSSVASFAARGALVNLDPYVAKSAAVDRADYVEAFVTNSIWEEKLFALPFDGESTALIYRTDRFEEAGIAGPPTTWEEFQAAAEAMTNVDEQKYGFIIFAPEAAYYFYPWLWQNGGDVFNEDGTEVIFNNDAGKEAAEFYVNLANYSPPDYYNSNSYDGRVAFATGQVGMYVAGAWFVATLADQYPDIDGKWSTAPLPQRKRCATTIAGDALAIPSLSKNQDAAWKWIEYLSAPQNMALWNAGTPSEPGSLLAPRTSLLTNPALFENSPLLKGFADQMACGVSGGAANPKGPEIEQALNDALGRAIYGEVGASDALDEAALEVEDILAE